VVGEVEPNNSFSLYQPLNNDTSYTVNANLSERVVFSSNFDFPIPPEISPGAAGLYSVQGYGGLGPPGNQFGGTFLRSPTGNVVTLSLSGLPAHTAISLDFLFPAIDSLDGTGVFPAGDFFKVTLDGNPIFRHSFANARPDQFQSYVPPTGVQLARRVDLGFTPPGQFNFFLDSAYHLGYDPVFHNIPHTGPTATFTFQIEGPGIQPLDDESWAMDNLRITVVPTDLDYYAFYAKKDSPIDIRAVAAQLTGDQHTEFDPTLGLFDPTGTLVRADDNGGAGGGSFWAARITYTATVSGVWRIAVSHHGDLLFDGTNTRPSYNPNNPNSGPGVHNGPYVLTITGAQKPEIVVKEPAGVKEFFIDGGDPPRMPQLTVEVIGITPAPGVEPEYTWQTRVDYRAADYPAVPGQRGQGRDIASPAYDDKTVKNDTEFEPTFLMGTNQVIRGGTLKLTAKLTVAGTDVEAKTPETGNDRLRILGNNPTPATVSAYVSALGVPNLWGTLNYNYHTVVRQIISQESLVRQFDPNNVPLWSQDNARGVGLMQITNPAPTDDEVWDWRKNIDRGVLIFRMKLVIARQRLQVLVNQVVNEAATMGATVAPFTPDMVVLNAIRGYNGYNNGNGQMDEYRHMRDAQNRLVIMNGRTVWERVPVAVRGTQLGDPDYVNHVLGRPDF
jgi:hypothetical protein